MYVCICNAIRDSELRDAAVHCSGGPDEVYRFLGKTPQCRQCFDDAAEILVAARDARRVPALASP